MFGSHYGVSKENNRPYMATIRQFEDLEIWQDARSLTKNVYRVTRMSRFSRDFALRDQMRRASISVMANIAEGFARAGNREFARFLDIARSSAVEVQSLLYIALEEAYLTETEFAGLYEQCRELRVRITAMRNYLKSHDRPAASA